MNWWLDYCGLTNLPIVIYVNRSWFEIDFGWKISYNLTIFNFNFCRNHWAGNFIVKPVQTPRRGKFKLDFSLPWSNIPLNLYLSAWSSPHRWIMIFGCFWQDKDQFDTKWEIEYLDRKEYILQHSFLIHIKHDMNEAISGRPW